jgi:hypothetical protein
MQFMLEKGIKKKSKRPSSFRIMLDTPMNRKWMSKADTSTWTPLEYIAEYIYRILVFQRNNSFDLSDYFINGFMILHHVQTMGPLLS